MHAFRAGTLCPQPRGQDLVGIKHAALLRDSGARNDLSLGPESVPCSRVFPLLLALPSTFLYDCLSSLRAPYLFVGWLLSYLPSICFQALIKQDNLDAFNERDPYKADDSREEEEENDDDNSLEGETFPLERDEVMPPPLQHPQTDRLTCPKGLPWAPKVR